MPGSGPVRGLIGNQIVKITNFLIKDISNDFIAFVMGATHRNPISDRLMQSFHYRFIFSWQKNF